MGGLVDYAGLFPPAALGMATAVDEYAGHRAEQEAWMLGRFIVPAGRLAELEETGARYLDQGQDWTFSVLVGGRDSSTGALAAVEAQGRAITTFEQRFEGRARMEVLEAPIPVDGSGPDVGEFLGRLTDSFATVGLGGRELYLEVLPGVDDDRVIKTIRDLAASETRFQRIGAKLRCGGITPEAFPSCERIAGFIDTCRKLGVPLKCTAGLHHPIRHLAADPQVMMHGFLNVFGAGILAHALGTGREMLTACVSETDPGAFSFSDDRFAWRDHLVTTEALVQAREGFLSGFGSCSFDEPRDDLRVLGLM